MSTRPWSAIPAQRSPVDKLKMRRRIIYGFLTVILLTGPTACVIAGGAASTAERATQSNAELVLASAAAQTVAWSFLAGEGSPIATVAGVDASLGALDSGDPKPFGNVESVSYAGTETIQSPDPTKPEVTWQVSRFWVQSEGITYALSITTTNGQGGPVLAATPSLSRLVTAAEGVEGLDFSTMVGNIPVDSYPGLLNRVKVWAEAYGAGNLDRLAEISENGPTSTIALGTAATATSEESIIYTPSNVDVISIVNRGDGTVSVQVSVTFTNTTNDFTMTNNYDLLVLPKGNGGDLSVIQQWGPTGQFLPTSE